MKFTREEEELIAYNRRRDKENKEYQAEQTKRWEAEQKRMDTPGLGCLDCNKTERQVANEGRWVGNRRVESCGKIMITQWLGGGAMTEREYGSIIEKTLCNDCLKKRVKLIEEGK